MTEGKQRREPMDSLLCFVPSPSQLAPTMAERQWLTPASVWSLGYQRLALGNLCTEGDNDRGKAEKIAYGFSSLLCPQSQSAGSNDG